MGHQRSHREGEEVKDLCAVAPGICIAVLSLALVIEAVHLHTGALACASVHLKYADNP